MRETYEMGTVNYQPVKLSGRRNRIEDMVVSDRIHLCTLFLNVTSFPCSERIRVRHTTRALIPGVARTMRP